MRRDRPEMDAPIPWQQFMKLPLQEAGDTGDWQINQRIILAEQRLATIGPGHWRHWLKVRRSEVVTGGGPGPILTKRSQFRPRFSQANREPMIASRERGRRQLRNEDERRRRRARSDQR